MNRPIVLFDLDGTVSDSAAGILAALRRAFVEHGIAPLDPATERALLGPPFYESLPPFVGADRVPAIIASYREHYARTMYETTAFDGVPAVLRALRTAGRRLAVATSKPEPYAVPIVEHLGLSEAFETIGGDELDGSLCTKALVIGKVLRRLGDPPARDVIMVGDRVHDVLGAREHGIECVAVRWGYAAPGELDDAQPARIVDSPVQLAAELGVPVGAPGEQLRSARILTWRSLRWVLRNRAWTPWYLIRYWRFLLLKVGNPDVITRGFVFLDRGAHVYVRAGYGRVILGKWVHLGANTALRCHEGTLSLGDKSNLARDISINCYLDVEIGDSALIADDVYISDFDHRFDDLTRTIKDQGIVKSRVRIERDVWLGTKVTVCRGVVIGQGTVVGANAVVTKDLPAFSVAVGVPARVIKDRKLLD